MTDYFKDIETRIYPVGRLDYDTSGLLLLTNDGEFTNLMTHPRYHIKKKYVAKLKGYLMREEVKALEKGIELEDGFTQPAQVKVKTKTKIKIRRSLKLRLVKVEIDKYVVCSNILVTKLVN